MTTADQDQGTLSVTDNRTGRTYEVPIKDGAISAMALRDIKLDEDDFGLLSYDPAFMNTASCRSAITFIDGEQGILRYRGYSIEELAEKSTFVEVSYLLIYGHLPNKTQLAGVGQVALDQQPGHLQEAGPLGQLLDWVAAVAQDPLLAVDVGDGAAA